MIGCITNPHYVLRWLCPKIILLKNHRSEGERLRESCWNAPYTPICKMLVVSLDFFPFIILSPSQPNSAGCASCGYASKTINFVARAHENARSIMMNHEKKASQEARHNLFPLSGFALRLLIDLECIIGNQCRRICSMSLLRKSIFLSSKLVYWGLFFTLTSTRMIYAGNKSISINTYVAAVITLRESEAGEFSAKH